MAGPVALHHGQKQALGMVVCNIKLLSKHCQYWWNEASHVSLLSIHFVPLDRLHHFLCVVLLTKSSLLALIKCMLYQEHFKQVVSCQPGGVF